MTKQYVKITGPMTNCTWGQTEEMGFNKIDKFEMKKIYSNGEYSVYAPTEERWRFPASSVELVEEQEGQEEPSAEPKPIEEKMRDTRDAMSIGQNNPLANVPKLEDCPKMMYQGEEVLVIAEGGNYIDSAIGYWIMKGDGRTAWVTLPFLTPIPTKQPWGQAEFLTQLAKWGTMEGVEVKATGFEGWCDLEGVFPKKLDITEIIDGAYTTKEPSFDVITHIRINNGEPVECVK